MSRRHSTLLRGLMVAAAAASLAACASKPKPAPMAETLPPPPGAAGAGTGAAPTGPATAGGYGAAPVGGVIPGSAQDFAANAGDRVYFDLDSWQLRDEARQVLDAQAAWLARYPRTQVRIEGNADERGTREYNLALGARRASAVREYLSTRGLSPARMDTISYGKERPLDESGTEEGYARNRNARTALEGGAG